MNNLIKVLAPIFFVAAFSSCAETAFRPMPAPNPWADDYRAVSSIDNNDKWGTYNVHDPAVCLVGDTFYMYSTDAIFVDTAAHTRMRPKGFVQMRKSADLVNWQFAGWAFPEIPAEAVEWVRSNNNGHGAHNVWAPYMVDMHDGTFHLYYCVSAFGKNSSYIGLAEAPSPLGPWKHVAPAVKTNSDTPTNAIDPSVITTSDGRCFMHYGSYFGGLNCLELNPATGLPTVEGDLGSKTASRANYRHDNIEAPEIIFNPDNGFYYLFLSYDPLMTTYNVRVGRSRSAKGPFTDMHGRQLADSTENFPILTAPYRFEGHSGWVGTGHCGVFTDADGNFFMAHQGRLASAPDMMVLHVRRMFFTPDGWPMVSPERYAAVRERFFKPADIEGEWEIMRLFEPRADRSGSASALLSECDLLDGDGNGSQRFTLCQNGKIEPGEGSWHFDSGKQTLSIAFGDDRIDDIAVFAGHDWEREHDTALLTGLDRSGRALWGKRVK